MQGGERQQQRPAFEARRGVAGRHRGAENSERQEEGGGQRRATAGAAVAREVRWVREDLEVRAAEVWIAELPAPDPGVAARACGPPGEGGDGERQCGGDHAGDEEVGAGHRREAEVGGAHQDGGVRGQVAGLRQGEDERAGDQQAAAGACGGRARIATGDEEVEHQAADDHRLQREGHAAQHDGEEAEDVEQLDHGEESRKIGERRGAGGKRRGQGGGCRVTSPGRGPRRG